MRPVSTALGRNGRPCAPSWPGRRPRMDPGPVEKSKGWWPRREVRSAGRWTMTWTRRRRFPPYCARLRRSVVFAFSPLTRDGWSRSSIGNVAGSSACARTRAEFFLGHPRFEGPHGIRDLSKGGRPVGMLLLKPRMNEPLTRRNHGGIQGGYRGSEERLVLQTGHHGALRERPDRKEARGGSRWPVRRIAGLQAPDYRRK